ncbi:MAG: hypothetical protein HQK50_08755 [Oligoflexia bacterium]|nr:hypothetical protein [Oligoflexia bacterium]
MKWIALKFVLSSDIDGFNLNLTAETIFLFFISFSFVLTVMIFYIRSILFKIKTFYETIQKDEKIALLQKENPPIESIVKEVNNFIREQNETQLKSLTEIDQEIILAKEFMTKFSDELKACEDHCLEIGTHLQKQEQQHDSGICKLEYSLQQQKKYFDSLEDIFVRLQLLTLDAPPSLNEEKNELFWVDHLNFKDLLKQSSHLLDSFQESIKQSIKFHEQLHSDRVHQSMESAQLIEKLRLKYQVLNHSLNQIHQLIHVDTPKQFPFLSSFFQSECHQLLSNLLLQEKSFHQKEEELSLRRQNYITKIQLDQQKKSASPAQEVSSLKKRPISSIILEEISKQNMAALHSLSPQQVSTLLSS